MTSRRLDNLLRKRILYALLDFRFKEWAQSLEDRKHEIALAIYHDNFSAEDQALMASLPDGWLEKGNHVRASIGATFESISLEKELPFPADKLLNCLAVYDGGHPIATAWESLQYDIADLKSQRREASRVAESVLNSVTMTGALISRWPEIAPFIPPEAIPENLPDIPVERINKIFGLPADEKLQNAG